MGCWIHMAKHNEASESAALVPGVPAAIVLKQ